MRDVLLNGYIGGCGVKMFPSNAAAFNQALNERLSLDENMMSDVKGVPSIFPIPVPFSWTATDVIGVSDRILPWTVASNSAAQYNTFPGGRFAWAVLYGHGFDMTSVHYGEDQRAIQGQEFMSNGSINNSMCFLGPHRRQSSIGKEGFSLVPGQGHMGTDALPGTRTLRPCLSSRMPKIKHARMLLCVQVTHEPGEVKPLHLRSAAQRSKRARCTTSEHVCCHTH